MTGSFHPARTDTYSHAISALLTRRVEMMENVAELRERLAVVSNDIEALDRTLESLGYEGDVPLTTRLPRVVLFYRGELRNFLRKELETNGPMSSRQLANRLMELESRDSRDHRMMNDIVKRIGKALRQMMDSKIVTRTPSRVSGEYIWTYVPPNLASLPGR